MQTERTKNVLRVGDEDRSVSGSSSFLSTQVAVLKSRDLAERVIRSEHLAENEDFLRPSAQRRSSCRRATNRHRESRPR